MSETVRGASRAAWLGHALILAAATWLYVPALHTDFFADDYLFLDQVRDRSLISALQQPDPLSNFYRPISRQLYFWTIARLTHESPVAFRVGNLLTLLVVLTLLFLLARFLAGDRAGLIACGFLALHYAADVPVRWACGSQELLAVAGALAALLLHVTGRRAGAGVAMLFAALSKEVILLTPLIAVIMDRKPGESWLAAARRAWPMGAAVVAWAMIWLLMPHARAAQSTEVEFNLVTSPLAAFAHLSQVVLGAEWKLGEMGRLPTVPPPIVPLVLALGAIVVVWRASRTTAAPAVPAKEPSRERPRERPRAGARGGPAVAKRSGAPTDWHVVGIGVAWALLATLPVAAVAILWSAYYYLFAMCGVALALGALLASRPVGWSIAALAALAWGSASARGLEEFAVPRDAWTPQSHINRHYIDRSNKIVEDYLRSLERAHPKLPDASTLFFAGLKGNVAFQRADGPLLRWAYRDSSLRSYYLNMFSRDKVGRGPLYFFVAEGDTLREMEAGDDLYERIAFGMILSDQPKSARDALTLAMERNPANTRAAYWLAWTQWALSDTAAALATLARSGVTVQAGEAPETRIVLPRAAAGDTTGALAIMRDAVRHHPLDPAAHALLADLLLVHDRGDPDGILEAYATRVLAPSDPIAWRRWGMIQTDRQRFLEALQSFNRYFKLGGASARGDQEAQQWVTTIRGMVPGGDLDRDAPQ
jgi:hypothetical protein